MRILSRFGMWLRYLLGRVLTLIEAFLIIRIGLKFFGANASALVVRVLYEITENIVSPFSSIFPNIYLGSHLLDVIAISAAVGYMIIYLIALAILRAIFRE